MKVLAVLSLIGSTLAIMVVSPDNTTTWSSSATSQMVSWQAVATDPTTFTIQLVQNGGANPVTLTSAQSTGSANIVNSASVTYPSGTWPTGSGFQVNLVQVSTSGQTSILAQSGMFAISGTGGSTTSGSSSSSLSMSAPTTISGLSTSTTTVSATSTTSGSGNASGGIPNASSSKSSAPSTPPPSSVVALLVGALGLARFLL